MRAHLVAIALLCAACASSRSDGLEQVPPPRATVPVQRLVRTHEPRPAEETAEATAACDGGDVQLCHAAALDAFYAAPSPESDTRALTLFTKACDAGYAPSCNGLGVLHEQGRGVPKDPAAAVALYRRSCESDGSTGCQHLAAALRSGKGIKKDPAAAERAEARGKCLFAVSLATDAGPCPALDP